jgi:hypothetical protein
MARSRLFILFDTGNFLHMSDAPKLFVSYSWTSPAHEQWVLDLAERLTQDGVHVIIDKWDLREGHDAHAFMEQMVTNREIGKVAIIFDREYVRRADDRDRGVGTETRLITGEIYKKSAQDKFVAVIAEKDEDNKPYVPAYYSGRIYVDLADVSRYEEQYERLLRWIFDKPLYSRPAIGKAPSFLDDKPTVRLGNLSDFKRAIAQLQEGKANASAVLGDYFSSVADAFEDLRITRQPEVEFDDQVVESIDSFLATREDLLNVIRTIARYQPTEENVTKLHRFFEKLIPFMVSPPNVGQYYESDFDNYRFIIHELYLYCIAILLDEERFEQASNLIDTDFVVERHHQFGNEPLVSPLVFISNLQSLEDRKQRLKLQRSSVGADILKQRCQSSGVPFLSLTQADIVIFLALDSRGQRWWPETSVFLTSFGARTILPLFARATSKRFFEKLRPVLGGETLDRFKSRLARLHATESEPRWNYHRVNIGSLVNEEALGTSN